MAVFLSAPITKSCWRIHVMEDHGGASNRILGWAPSVPVLFTQVMIIFLRLLHKLIFTECACSGTEEDCPIGECQCEGQLRVKQDCTEAR